MLDRQADHKRPFPTIFRTKFERVIGAWPIAAVAIAAMLTAAWIGLLLWATYKLVSAWF